MAEASRQNFDRFWNMTRRMKPGQFYGRVHRALVRVSTPSPRLDALAASMRWAGSPAYQPPFLWWRTDLNRAEEILRGRFRLVGVPRDLGGAGGRGIDWVAEGATEHWVKMLHAFDWLGHLGPDQARTLLRAYAGEMPRSRKHKAWDAWTAAFRVQSVLRWHAEHRADPELARHVALWTNQVAANLEWRIMGNHLLKDALALSLAGRFLEGPLSAGWRQTGDQLLLRLLPEQILPDGGHDELAPMYHALILYDLTDALSAVQPGETVFPLLESSVQRMATFLRGTLHPDGEVANLSDSGAAVAPEPASLLEKAAALGCAADPPTPGFRAYPDFGVRVLESGPWWVIFDAGPAALEHLPAHGHADSLTVEASYEGARLFADTGVSTYTGGPDRDRERGTDAHNTACVAGRNSSDVYAEFRMGRRARITRAGDSGPSASPWSEAAHDGYRDLPGSPVHARRVELRPPATLFVRDTVEASGAEHPWRVHWHFAPGWSAEAVGGPAGVWRLSGPGGRRVEARCTGGVVSVERARVSLRFGMPEEAARLVGSAGPGDRVMEWAFSPAPGA